MAASLCLRVLAPSMCLRLLAELSVEVLAALDDEARQQGLTLVPISAQLELFRPPYDPS